MTTLISVLSGVPRANKNNNDDSNGAAAAPLFVPSKWESVDPSKAEEEAVTSNRWELFADAEEDGIPLPSGEAGGNGKDVDEDMDGR